MMQLSKFIGVSTPIEDLAVAIQNQGWQLSSVQWDSKLGQYTAEALSPHGEKLEKFGPDANTAVANTLLAVTRRNHMRTTAQFKVGMWRTNWHERLQDIAEAYRDAPIYDPKAVAAWKMLADDSMHRLHVLGGQLHIEPTNEPQPYASADEMRKDVHEKRHYYLSRAGTSHPVWTSDQVAAFRAVHDILGHGVAGGHYDWPGRNLAAAAHMPLLEPLAQQALFAETVGRQAFLQTYGHGPQKVALFPEFVDHHQGINQGGGHRGIHPSQTTAPVALPKPFALSKTAGTTIDVNKGWESGVEPLPYNGFVHHGDPMEMKATMDNAGLIDTGWEQFKRGDGSDDLDRMRQAIVNAFRVVLLSPRKDLRWNAVHYQDILNIPASVDDPKVYWEALENSRRRWNVAQGIDPESHMIYFKFLKPFEAHILAQHPEKGWEWAKEEARSVMFDWWTEEQERISAEDEDKPADKQRSADEIERRANEALATRMKDFLKPKNEKTDVEDQPALFMAHRKESDNAEELIKMASSPWPLGDDGLPVNPNAQSDWEKRRDQWAIERDAEHKRKMDLYKLDPQAYYEQMWAGEGDITHPYHGQFVEWVPTQHMLPYAEWKRNPAHGAPVGESASQEYWDMLKANIMRDGIKNPISLEVHKEDGTGHIGEGNHRLAVAEALGMPYVPVTVWTSRRRGNRQHPVPGYDPKGIHQFAERLKPSEVGLPVQQRTANSDYEIRPADEGWFSHDTGRFIPRYMNDQDTLQTKHGLGEGMVAYHGGEPVASVTWQRTPNGVMLGSAYTHPDHRQRGLFNRLTESIRGENVDAIHWDNPMLKNKVRGWRTARTAALDPIDHMFWEELTPRAQNVVLENMGRIHQELSLVPGGPTNCGEACSRWARAFQQAGIPVQQHTGNYHQHPVEGSYPTSTDHVWLTVDGMLFDPTASQFSGQGPIEMEHYRQGAKKKLKVKKFEPPSKKIQEELYRKQMGEEHEFQTPPAIPQGAKPLNVMTGEDSLKYGAFMGTHLKSISQVSQHADDILKAALADVREHDATGHHFRHEVLKLNVPGVGPKVCSFAWLLLQPLRSQLATIDVHMMDVLGHNYEKEMSNRDYFKFERQFRAGLDAAGYGEMPLGAAQWGMWDYKRTGPGTHQDHSAMRVVDPKPHNQIDWATKAPTTTDFKKNWADSVDWWAATKPVRDQVGQEWDSTYGKTFKKNAVPYQDVGTIAKIAYGEHFDHYWDKLMPVKSDLNGKAKKVAEYARVDDMSYGDLEDWLRDHKKDADLSEASYKRFTKLVLRKMDRISKVAGTRVPVFKHPETGEAFEGLPGQSMMEHARLQLGLSTQDVWRMLKDEHIQKV